MGEPGIEGVTLVLWTDDDNDGLPDTNTGVTTETAADGTYEFTELAAGNYVIQIPLTNFGPGGALEGMENSTGNDPTPDPDDDNINDDDNGIFVNGVGIINLAATLTLDEEPINDGDTDPNTNLTVDFGFFDPSTQPTPMPTPDTSDLAAIGNFVFFDTDQDGLQDPDEEGVAGVIVVLEELNPDGSSTQIAQIATGKNGEYLFSDAKSRSG